MKLTEKRRAALKQVQAGEVELRWPFGRGDSYFVAAATSGRIDVDSRSLKWLREQGFIGHRMSGTFKVSEVYVTDAGLAALGKES
ncbi:hypothetical protein [Cellulosimicrobium cellulans]|uniref:hypothetical protein n=1 Tax=Cellulosimicrobium cellulans TaxID=1710 RepID=UPI003C3551DF